LQWTNEAFEKHASLFKFKEGDNFNRRNTRSILRINPPKFGGGLKFEPDAEIGQKGGFCKSLKSTDPVMGQPLTLSIGEDVNRFSPTDASLDLLPKMHIK